MMVDVKNINKSRIQKVSAMHHGGGATLCAEIQAKKQNSKDYRANIINQYQLSINTDINLSVSIFIYRYHSINDKGKIEKE